MSSIDLAPLMKPASIAVVGASQRMTRATRVDINPLLVLDAGRGVVAVDWLIELA